MNGRPRIGVILPHADLGGGPDELATYGRDGERLGFVTFGFLAAVVGVARQAAQLDLLSELRLA